jgi:hypothetical protein
MAFTTGGLIEAAHFNAIQSTVANVLGTGSGNSGYGQALQSAQVAAAQLIEDDHLNTLRLDIRKAYLHQNNSYPTLNVVSTANTVDYVNVLSNSWSLFETLANNINTNRNTISASRLTSAATASSYVRTPVWNATRVGSFTVTFASATAARHFFNTGGAVQISMNISGSAISKVTDWNTLFNTNMGTLTFANLASSRSGSGGTLSSSVAYTTLTTTFQTVYTTTSSGTYAANNFNIQVRFTSVSNLAIEFQITLNDAAVGNVDENVNGNLNINVNRRIANGALSDPITIAAPTFSAMSGTVTT